MSSPLESSLLDDSTSPSDAPLPLASINGSADAVGQTITLASGASLTVQSDGTFSYTPAADYLGSDSFTYTTTDGEDFSNTATVTLNVVTQAISVTPPTYSTPHDQQLFADAGDNPTLLDDASDVTGATLSITSVNGNAANVGQAVILASGGSVTVQSDGSFVYTPVAGYVGSDSFTFTASDSNGDSSPTTSPDLQAVYNAAMNPAKNTTRKKLNVLENDLRDALYHNSQRLPEDHTGDEEWRKLPIDTTGKVGAFVGDVDWGFSVWAHNTYYQVSLDPIQDLKSTLTPVLKGSRLVASLDLNRPQQGPNGYLNNDLQSSQFQVNTQLVYLLVDRSKRPGDQNQILKVGKTSITAARQPAWKARLGDYRGELWLASIGDRTAGWPLMEDSKSLCTSSRCQQDQSQSRSRLRWRRYWLSRMRCGRHWLRARVTRKVSCCRWIFRMGSLPGSCAATSPSRAKTLHWTGPSCARVPLSLRPVHSPMQRSV